MIALVLAELALCASIFVGLYWLDSHHGLRCRGRWVLERSSTLTNFWRCERCGAETTENKY